MQTRTKKKMRTSLTRGQNRLMRDSLKMLLGQGLLKTPQRGQHEIHPFFLRDALNSRILNN